MQFLDMGLSYGGLELPSPSCMQPVALNLWLCYQTLAYTGKGSHFWNSMDPPNPSHHLVIWEDEKWAKKNINDMGYQIGAYYLAQNLLSTWQKNLNNNWIVTDLDCMNVTVSDITLVKMC